MAWKDGAVMVKVSELETTVPLLPGMATLMVSGPSCWRIEVGTLTVSCVLVLPLKGIRAMLGTAALAEPMIFTVDEPGKKSTPVRVRVNELAPSTAELWLRLLMKGPTFQVKVP